MTGKPFADAIRSNPSNPNPSRDPEGVHTPPEGAPEWRLGAGAMANDPRDRQLTNAKLDFVKPKEGPQAVRDLAIMRPVLVATRDIPPGEEVLCYPHRPSSTLIDAHRPSSPFISIHLHPSPYVHAGPLVVRLGDAFRAPSQAAARSAVAQAAPRPLPLRVGAA